MKQRSIEHHNSLVMSDYGIAFFQKFSAVTLNMVQNLKNLHPMSLWLARPFFAAQVWQQGLNVIYNVDKDGKPKKCTRIVERVMQCISHEQTIFVVPFLSMKNSLRNSFTFPSEAAFKRFDKNQDLTHFFRMSFPNDSDKFNSSEYDSENFRMFNFSESWPRRSV